MPNTGLQTHLPNTNKFNSRVELKKLDHACIHNGYLQWMNNSEINQYLESRFKAWSENDLKAYIDQMNGSSTNHFFGIFTDENKYIGNIKLGPIDTHHKRASVGIMIGDISVHGKGYGLSALQQIMAMAFDDLGLEKITAGCYAVNTASQRLFEKAGFRTEATLREHVCLDGARADVILMACHADDYKAVLMRGVS